MALCVTCYKHRILPQCPGHTTGSEVANLDSIAGASSNAAHLEHASLFLLQPELIIGVQDLMQLPLQQVSHRLGIAIDAVVQIPHPEHNIMIGHDITTACQTPTLVGQVLNEADNNNGKVGSRQWRRPSGCRRTTETFDLCC